MRSCAQDFDALRERSGHRRPHRRARRVCIPCERTNAKASANNSGGKRVSSPPKLDADDVEVRKRNGELRRCHRRFGAEVPREIEKELKRRARLCGAQFVHERLEAAANVEFRVEKRPHRRRDEQLAVHHVLRERVFDELAGQPRVVVGRLQRAANRSKQAAKTRRSP